MPFRMLMDSLLFEINQVWHGPPWEAGYERCSFSFVDDNGVYVHIYPNMFGWDVKVKWSKQRYMHADCASFGGAIEIGKKMYSVHPDWTLEQSEKAVFGDVEITTIENLDLHKCPEELMEVFSGN